MSGSAAGLIYMMESNEMKYTKEQLNGMSDTDIEALLNDLVHGFELNYKAYLDDWNELMPLVVDHGISLKNQNCPAGSGYAQYAESYCGRFYSDYDIPQRAIACCLILVLQEKNK